MFFPALALKSAPTMVDTVVFGSGLFGQAVASVLAMEGHSVSLVGSDCHQETRCAIWKQGRFHHSGTVLLNNPNSVDSLLKSVDLIILAVAGTEYGAAVENIVSALKSGQTIFLVGAPFGAAFEVGSALCRRRRDLAVNIIETSQPFVSFESNAQGLQIYGLKERLVVAGRTLNETRAGLSIGGSLFSGMVPASNILERGFSNIDKWVRAAGYLFGIFGPDGQCDNSGQAGARAAVAMGFRNELETLARVYGVSHMCESAEAAHLPGLSVAARKEIIELAVVEDLVLLSSLARLMYLQVPLIESVIELSSVVIGIDLRKEGRQLEDLGLIGMDANEIAELVSA